MVFDFDFQQVMRLSNLKRWGIVEMSRTQSVAEHSYNVAMISAMIVDKLPPALRSVDLREIVVNWALVHDLPELVTGDVPTPIKEKLHKDLDKAEQELFPKLMFHKDSLGKLPRAICKCADLLDALQFASKFCVDSRKTEIIEEMEWNLDEVATEMLDVDTAIELEKVISEIWAAGKILSKNT